jgi:hypothetical protein
VIFHVVALRAGTPFSLQFTWHHNPEDKELKKRYNVTIFVGKVRKGKAVPVTGLEGQ